MGVAAVVMLATASFALAPDGSKRVLPEPARAPSPDPGSGSRSVEAHVTVRADRGPEGGEPVAKDRRLFSTNVWFSNGWYPTMEPGWRELLGALEPGMIRWPGGDTSQDYCWQAQTRDQRWPGCEGRYVLPRAQLLEFINVSREAGAEPVLTINVQTAPPRMAAAIVHYVNVEHERGVTWWQLGNEPDLREHPPDPIEHAMKLNRYADAMRTVDPAIKLVGPEWASGLSVTGDHGHPDRARPFLHVAGETVDAVSWHHFPLDSANPDPGSPAHPTPEHLLQWESPDWQPSGISFIERVQDKLRADRDELAPGTEVWVTELGPDAGAPGAPGVTDGQVAAVWFADVIGRFAGTGTDAVFQFAFFHWQPGVDELSLTRTTEDGGYAPLPPYYTYWLYGETWGDRFRVVHAESDADATVSAHAAVREDGALAVVLVNKADEPARVTMDVEGFAPAGSARAYEVTAPSPMSLNATVNGEAPTLRQLVDGTVPARDVPAGTQSAWELPPTSVTFLVLPEA